MSYNVRSCFNTPNACSPNIGYMWTFYFCALDLEILYVSFIHISTAQIVGQGIIVGIRNVIAYTIYLPMSCKVTNSHTPKKRGVPLD